MGLDEQLASIRTTEINIETLQKELDGLPAKQKDLRTRITALKKDKAKATAELREQLPAGVVRKRKATTAQ